MSQTNSRKDREKKRLIIYVFVWVLFLTVVLMLAYPRYSNPDERTYYLIASKLWFSGGDIYIFGPEKNTYGFLYLPMSALLCTPFQLLPNLYAQIALRTFFIFFLGLTVWRLAHTVSEKQFKPPLLYLTIMAFTSAWAALKLGQLTIPMTVFMILASVELMKLRYWWATLWLCLAVAIKPLAFIYVLMVAVIYRPMSWRLAIGLSGVFVIPFFTQDAAFVWDTYNVFFQKLRTVLTVENTEKHFKQIYRVWEFIGINFSYIVKFIIRLLAALFTLGLGITARKRWPAIQASAAVISLSVLYVLLFNPRSEGNTYAMILPVALFPYWTIWGNKRKIEGFVMLLVFISILASYELTGGSDFVLKPLMALGIYIYIALLIIADKQPRTVISDNKI